MIKNLLKYDYLIRRGHFLEYLAPKKRNTIEEHKVSIWECCEEVGVELCLFDLLKWLSKDVHEFLPIQVKKVVQTTLQKV